MNSEINDKSLWNDDAIQKTIDRLNPEQLFRYQKMGKALYDKVNESDPITDTIEVATQIRLMLRDGIHPNMLTESERQIYIDAYGLKSLEEYTKDDDDKHDDKRPDTNQTKDRSKQLGTQSTKKTGN
jgi:hypothetical protein